MTHETLQSSTPPRTRKFRVHIDQMMSHDITVEAPDVESAQRIAHERYDTDRVLYDYIPPLEWCVTYGTHEVASVEEITSSPTRPAQGCVPETAAISPASSVRETTGLVCPGCNRDDYIVVETSEWVKLLPDGHTESVGDQEWALDSAIHCRHCGRSGIVAEFGDEDSDAAEPIAQPKPVSLPVSTDICCELAHKLTLRECGVRGLPLDADFDTDDDEVHYTDDAQQVFNAIFDIVSNVLQAANKEVVQ